MRAILSVYDKTGLDSFARGLVDLGFELVASGGTARALHGWGLPVTLVEDITGYPEMLGGRVKTLHPAIHAGILAPRSPDALAELDRHDIAPIDLVACNLYPFGETVARPDFAEADAIEQIDIGGVTLLRAAAKNFESVVVVADPADYAPVLEGLASGSVDRSERRRLALKAFALTSAYDAAIVGWLESEEVFPGALRLAARRVQVLRYGENPHQQAALYRWSGPPSAFEQLQGKELSYNNIVDLEAAWDMPQEFDRPAVAIIKHTNPSGLAVAASLVDAYRLAYECDPVSAFGGIIACNREIDLPFVEAVGGLFVEVLAAPGYTQDALAWLRERKPNCRVMRARGPRPPALVLRSVSDGLLAQTPDLRGVDGSAWQLVTKRSPTGAEREALAFAWIAAKHAKSNAIVLAQSLATVGVGAGQMNRVDSVRLAVGRAGERARGAVLGSDAFFPFADGLEVAGEAGVTAVIQPGGSMRDAEVIAMADQWGMAMVFTGERHFLH
jgi:phosphoribosylaminoimidazolecarboxamide formyltransferase/IMP cyclohydrolase